MMNARTEATLLLLHQAVQTMRGDLSLDVRLRLTRQLLAVILDDDGPRQRKMPPVTERRPQIERERAA